MRLQPLNHLIEVIRAVARPARICVLGSASLLPEHPELGDSGGVLELTADADFLLEPVDEAIAESLQLAAGRDSAFMARNGYYADILRPTITETLPVGWQNRLHRVAGFDDVYALDLYDLALVKLVVGRQKDIELLRALLRLGILDSARLRRHYQSTPLGEQDAFSAGRSLTLLIQGLPS